MAELGKNLQILVLSETKIQKDYSDSQLKKDLDDWNVVYRYDAGDSSKHMGLLLLTSKKNDTEYDVQSVKEISVKRNTLLQCQGLLVELSNHYILGFI